MLTKQQQLERLLLIKNDFNAFRRFLKIIDRKTSKVVPFQLNNMQTNLHNACTNNKRVFELKSRQLGSTTYCLARAFWLATMRHNYQVLVVAHTAQAATTIFRMIKRFYDNLPKELQLPLAISSTSEHLYKHGGGIRVSTASSESPRGQTNNLIIGSEFAFWTNPEETIAAFLQSLTPDGQVILETTARGFNFAQKLWYDPNCAYYRTFDSWKDDTLCRSDKTYDFIPNELAELAERFHLDEEQLNWAARKLAEDCMGNWRTFCQELALTPDIAFVATGDRVFPRISFAESKINYGYIEYEQPNKYGIYCMGVDVATGASDGDLSAFVVLECSNRSRPRIVATFYERVNTYTYAEKVLECARRYKALLAIEHNHAGAAIIDHCTHAGYSRQYCRQSTDKLTNQITQQLGFSTNTATRPILINKLHSCLSDGTFNVIDVRLQAEIMSFIYGPNGKPEAASGRHDDIIIAFAIALAAMSQTHGMQHEQLYNAHPTTIQEVLQYEKATGNIWDEFSATHRTHDDTMSDVSMNDLMNEIQRM